MLDDIMPALMQQRLRTLRLYPGLQGFFGSGYFVEDKETDAPNYLRTLERKKVLSNIESLGLLSAAEKAGLSLSKVTPSLCFSFSLIPRPLLCMYRESFPPHGSFPEAYKRAQGWIKALPLPLLLLTSCQCLMLCHMRTGFALHKG